MLNKEREMEIVEILKIKGGFVTVKELCERLFASESSIRRDLKVLEQRGIIKRSYGGASMRGSFSNIATFSSRTRINTEAKKQIAKKAADLIEDGNIVFLDQSSTCFYLANELINKSSVTVITNNIEIIMLLSSTSLRIIASGGALSDENRNCLIGGDACRTFQGIYADLCFFSVNAVSNEGLITDCSIEEINVRNTMLKNADKCVLLCDSSKLGKRAHYRQCEITDIDMIICENENIPLLGELVKKIKPQKRL